MNPQRRDALKTGGHLGLLGLLTTLGLIRPDFAQAAWNQAAFEAKTLSAALAALGADKPADSGGIQITAPEIAENGAEVSVSIASHLAGTEEIALLVDKNPNMLAARFFIPEATIAEVQTRIKMRQSAHLHAVVKADGKFYLARKEVKVTLGGCGG